VLVLVAVLRVEHDDEHEHGLFSDGAFYHEV
jgi:hypothetical protein